MSKDIFFSKEKRRQYKKANRSKKRVIAIVAIIVAGAVALGSTITGIIIHFNNKKGKTNNKSNISISDMGTELEMPEEAKTNYGATTGKVDANKIVEKNGKIYVDQENANKADKVGTVVTDTKDNTLKVESNGTVKEIEKGYEIKDKETGSTIQSGNVNSDGSIDNYEENEELGGTYEEEDNSKDYVRSDANYYNEEGNCIIKKGDLLSKEALEYAKANLSTKPQTTTNTSSTTTSSTRPSTTGIINPDGTYTIYGMTFESKADYEQWVLQGYEGYVEIDGVMKSQNSLTKSVQKVK